MARGASDGPGNYRPASPASTPASTPAATPAATRTAEPRTWPGAAGATVVDRGAAAA